MPDGSLLLIDASGGLTGSVEPWRAGVYIPPAFEMDRTPVLWFGVPDGVEGDYQFAAGLTVPGTLNFKRDISYAPFAIRGGSGTGIRMLAIRAGRFLMGSPEDDELRLEEEGPQRTVNISAFKMSETEITQAQWEDVMGWNDSHFIGDDHPVEDVSWFDCVWFCNELSDAEGYAKCYTITDTWYDGDHITSADVTRDFEANGYRLPTEAEWEYACRANTTTRFYWGDSSEESVMKQYSWYDKNADDPHWTDPHGDHEGTQPVGHKIANAFGLYDMSGNVWEWCWDWYDSDYYEKRPDPDSDPTGASRGSYRVYRGGCWDNEAGNCRSAGRAGRRPSGWYGSLGLRLVRRP